MIAISAIIFGGKSLNKRPGEGGDSAPDATPGTTRPSGVRCQDTSRGRRVGAPCPLSKRRTGCHLLTEALAVAADDDALALGRPPTAPPAAGQASGCSRRSEGTTSEAAAMRASESQRVLYKLSVCGGICCLSISC